MKKIITAVLVTIAVLFSISAVDMWTGATFGYDLKINAYKYMEETNVDSYVTVPTRAFFLASFEEIPFALRTSLGMETWTTANAAYDAQPLGYGDLSLYWTVQADEVTKYYLGAGVAVTGTAGLGDSRTPSMLFVNCYADTGFLADITEHFAMDTSIRLGADAYTYLDGEARSRIHEATLSILLSAAYKF